MREKQIRDIAADLHKQASILEGLLPRPDMNQIDHEPICELGTRCVRYINGIRHVYRYAKIDAGLIGTDVDTGEEYRYIQFRWFKYK